MGVAATWLPPELWVIQPYSMGPLMGCPPDQSRPCPVARSGRFVSPANGTVALMDAPELAILTCFIAPAAVQRKAQKQGQRGLMMIMPKGLVETIGSDPKLWPRTRTKVPATMTWVDSETGIPMAERAGEVISEWEREQAARRAFAAALAALDEDEEVTND